MKRKSIIKLVILIGILGCIYIYMEYVLYNQTKRETYNVKISGITATESMDSELKVNGNLIVRNNKIHAVAMEYACKIVELYVENGQHVESAQKLFRVKRVSDNSEFTITSDYEGEVEYILDSYIGSYIPQFTTVLSVYQLSENSDFYVQAQIPVSEYKNLNDVSSIKLTFANAISNINVDGRIEDKSPQIRMQGNVQYYNVAISVDDSQAQLTKYKFIKGMSINTSINMTTNLINDTESKSVYFIVPFNAIVSRNDINVVFLYDGVGDVHQAQMVVVDILSTNGDTAVVKDSLGYLKKNSAIITEGNYKLNGNENVSTSEGK